jgi:hypothetical protein
MDYGALWLFLKRFWLGASSGDASMLGRDNASLYLCTSNMYHICPRIGGHISKCWAVTGVIRSTRYLLSAFCDCFSLLAQSVWNHEAYCMKHVLRVVWGGGAEKVLHSAGARTAVRAGLGVSSVTAGGAWRIDCVRQARPFWVCRRPNLHRSAAEAQMRHNQLSPLVARASLTRFESKFPMPGHSLISRLVGAINGWSPPRFRLQPSGILGDNTARPLRRTPLLVQTRVNLLKLRPILEVLSRVIVSL